jgi:hypothetical protein
MARHAGTDQDLLAMALIGYEAQMAKIAEAIRGIQAQLGHRGPGRPGCDRWGGSGKARLSASARGVAAAAKRWAAIRQARLSGQAKRKLSATVAGRSSLPLRKGGRLSARRLQKRLNLLRRGLQRKPHRKRQALPRDVKRQS